MNTLKKIIFIALILPATGAYCQCPLVPAACTGTPKSGSTNITIPSATTYYVPVATTLSGNVAFTDGTSVLCIEGTWTGALSSSVPPAGATINLYGTYTTGTSFSISGGGINVNIFPGAKFTSGGIAISSGTNNFMICDSLKIYPSGNITLSSGTNTITNHGTITLKSGFINPTAGTNTIDNYGTIRLLSGYYLAQNAGTTFHNYATGSLLAYGTNNGITSGTFINDGSSCTTGSYSASGGTFTNNSCISTNALSLSGGGTYTNNSAMNIFGDFSLGSSTTFSNNGTMKVFGNFSNSGTNFTNNGTINVVGNFTTSTSFTITDKSQVTSAGWNNSGTIYGPASGCGSFIATGNTTNSGTVSAANSSHVDIYDTGLPSAKGTPAFPLDGNTGNVNAATATGACATNSFGFADCRVTCSVLLPIELLMFIAQPAGKQVLLNWSTATETNNDYFTIERSAPDGIFKPIGTVKGAGNSSKTLTYTFYDELPLNGISYYRLKQTDYDGQYSYSVIAAVNCDDSPYSIIYPNPSKNGQVTINLSGEIGNEILIMIYNSLGEMVYAKTSVINTSSSQPFTTINTESNLAPGIYCVTVSDKYKTFNKVLVVSE